MYKIYKISCAKNGKVYIGYTSKTIEERFNLHMLNARWRRRAALYDAIRTYGNDAFSVELLMECENHESACAEEIRFIAEYNSMLPNGYNMTRGGDGVPVPIEVHKEAGKRKRGVVTEKMRAHFNRRKGIKHSPEHIAKCVAKRIGSKRSEETRRRMSAAQKGRVISEEARKNISKALKGRPWTQAQRDARIKSNMAREAQRVEKVS